MKKYLYSMLVLIFPLLLNAHNASAQDRRETKAFLIRTHMIIEKAKEAVTIGQVYTGDVVKAVHHQRFARELFRQGKYLRAIHHSYRAREFAHAAIRANKREITKEMELLDKEMGFVKNRPKVAELDMEVRIPAGVDEKVIVKEEEIHD